VDLLRFAIRTGKLAPIFGVFIAKEARDRFESYFMLF
jgi:hypothetical protein